MNNNILRLKICQNVEHVEYREVTAGGDRGEMMMRLKLVRVMMMTIVLSTAEYIEVVAGGGGGVAAEVQGCHSASLHQWVEEA